MLCEDAETPEKFKVTIYDVGGKYRGDQSGALNDPGVRMWAGESLMWIEPDPAGTSGFAKSTIGVVEAREIGSRSASSDAIASAT